MEQYRQRAEELRAAHGSGDPEAIRVIHENHPRFLDARISWLPKRLSASEIRSAPFELEDAQLTIARSYSFRNWAALAEYAEAVNQDGSAVFLFESAVEAVVAGEQDKLEFLLRENPDLVRARSTRVNRGDPSAHRATLLHYVAANGVEGHRQKTPVNAVEIAEILLESGAEVDALAEMYGGRYTTMCMLVSSGHPAKAGLQIALVETLLDFGASMEPRAGLWGAPLMTALAFGYREAAEALVKRGARLETLAAAAGLGEIGRTVNLIPGSSPHDRHCALALAAQHGHAEVVRLLLDAGEDPDRYNPEGFHGHSTPLHQAALAGHDAVVRLLVERGARLDIEDKIFQATPRGWAIHAGQAGIENYLSKASPPREET